MTRDQLESLKELAYWSSRTGFSVMLLGLNPKTCCERGWRSISDL